MLNETRTDKALNHTDDGASLVAAFVGLAGVMGWLSALEISLDQGAAIAGFAGMVITFIRGRLEKRRRLRLTDSALSMAAGLSLVELEDLVRQRRKKSARPTVEDVAPTADEELEEAAESDKPGAPVLPPPPDVGP